MISYPNLQQYTQGYQNNYNQYQNNYNQVNYNQSMQQNYNNYSTSIFPQQNYQNNTNINNTNIFNNLGGYQMIQQPMVMQQLIMMLLPMLLQPPVEEETLVEEDYVSGHWGDPHFTIEGQQAFDFQGNADEKYKMIDNSDINLTAKFGAYGNGATVVKEQDLKFKDEGIDLISHADGSFEILQNGKEIADETSYNKDEKVMALLKKKDISITKEGNTIKTVHGNRILSQSCNGTEVDNINDTLMKGDKGLLTQTAGSIDDNNDGETKLGDKTLKYDTKNQYMVHTDVSGSKCAPITEEIAAAIKKDLQAGIKAGSPIKGYSTDHGYDARQWNEYVGEKLYSA